MAFKSLVLYNSSLETYVVLEVEVFVVVCSAAALSSKELFIVILSSLMLVMLVEEVFLLSGCAK